MLQALRVDNFKALNAFEMELSPLTVVIGDNAAGKSTILQALVFLKYACVDTVYKYLDDRELSVGDIVSRLTKTSKKIIEFSVDFLFEKEKLRWDISFFTERTKGKIKLRSERVTLCGKEPEKILLEYNTKEAFRFNEKHSDIESIAKGVYPASQLSYIDTNRAKENYQHLCLIKQFFEETEPLDLLAPKNMRKSARGRVRTLGISGEKLPALIQQLSAEEKKQLQGQLNTVLHNLSMVKSVVHSRPGWAHIETEETFSHKTITVSSAGISDGTLRLVALFSLEFLHKTKGITLLDEVEDGIHMGNLESFFEFLMQYCERNQQQVFLTTHSTVLLDFVAAEAIRYIYRDEDGFVKCRKFIDLNEVKEQLDYLYPGEILLNTNRKTLLASPQEDSHD